MISDIIGVTISSPGYHELAQEAAQRFRKYTGCDALVLTTERRDSYDAKMALPFLGDRTICFFDADLWFVRRVDLEPFRQINGIAAVKDASRFCMTSICLEDALSLGFEPERYINTGLMIFRGGNPTIQSAFNAASSLIAERASGSLVTKDKTEQSLLNAGIHRSSVALTFLGDEWNFWPHAWHRGWMDKLPLHPYCVHAAGVLLPQKTQFLKDQCKVWEF